MSFQITTHQIRGWGQSSLKPECEGQLPLLGSRKLIGIYVSGKPGFHLPKPSCPVISALTVIHRELPFWWGGVASSYWCAPCAISNSANPASNKHFQNLLLLGTVPTTSVPVSFPERGDTDLLLQGYHEKAEEELPEARVCRPWAE